MSDPLAPRVGGIVSADIAVPEHERELRFYSRVLGTGAEPLWRDDLMNNRGTPIIGLGERTADHAALPLQWMPHIQVADVAASAARAIELGGRECMHGKDDDGNSQWAVLLDPDGAAFGIIPVVDAAEAVEAPTRIGHIAWADLTVANADASRAFYEQVVGWSVEHVAMADGSYSDYCMLDANGNAVAGICNARGPNEGMPAVWLLYLPVDDLDESLRRVEAEGGKVVKSKRGDGGRCTNALVQDPVGAFVTLVADGTS